MTGYRWRIQKYADLPGRFISDFTEFRFFACLLEWFTANSPTVSDRLRDTTTACLKSCKLQRYSALILLRYLALASFLDGGEGMA